MPKPKPSWGPRRVSVRAKDLALPELQETWQGRMSAKEVDVLASLEQKLGGTTAPADGNASARALEYATSHVFERKSVVPERQLLATALWHSAGKSTVEEIQRQAETNDFIIGNRNDRRMVTTRSVLDEERHVIDFARNGRGTCRAFARRHDKFNRDWLNDSQKKAVKHVVESRDRIILVRGAAGVARRRICPTATSGAGRRRGFRRRTGFSPHSSRPHPRRTKFDQEGLDAAVAK